MAQIDLENIGIKKSGIKQNKRANEVINKNTVKTEVTTRVVDMYEEPDSSNTELMKDFAGLVGKWGQIGSTITADISKQNEQDFIEQAQLDAFEGKKKTEEELRNKTNNTLLGDYSKYNEVYTDMVSKNESKRSLNETAAYALNNATEEKSAEKIFNEEFNNTKKELDNLLLNKEITDDEYSIMMNNFYKEKNLKLNQMVNFDKNQNLSRLKKEKQIILNSSDTKEVKIKKLQKLGLTQLKAEEEINQEENYKLSQDLTNYVMSNIQGVIDSEISSLPDGEEQAVNITNDNFDREIKSIADDKTLNTEAKKMAIDSLNKSRLKMLQSASKRTSDAEIQRAENFNNAIIKDTYETGDFNQNTIQEDYDKLISKKYGGLNNQAKGDKIVKEMVDIAILNSDLDYLDKISKIKTTDGVLTVGSTDNSLIEKAKDKIEYDLSKQNEIKETKLEFDKKDKWLKQVEKNVKSNINNIKNFEDITSVVLDLNSKSGENIKVEKWQYEAVKKEVTKLNTYNKTMLSLKNGVSVKSLKNSNPDDFFDKEQVDNYVNEIKDNYITNFIKTKFSKNPDEESSLKYLNLLKKTIELDGGKLNNPQIDAITKKAYEGDTQSLMILEDLEKFNLNPENLKTYELGLLENADIITSFNGGDRNKNIEIAASLKGKSSEINEKWSIKYKNNEEVRKKIEEYNKSGVSEDSIIKLKNMLKTMNYVKSVDDSSDVEFAIKKLENEKNTISSNSFLNPFSANFKTVGDRKMITDKNMDNDLLIDNIDKYSNLLNKDLELKVVNSNGKSKYILYDRNTNSLESELEFDTLVDLKDEIKLLELKNGKEEARIKYLEEGNFVNMTEEEKQDFVKTGNTSNLEKGIDENDPFLVK